MVGDCCDFRQDLDCHSGVDCAAGWCGSIFNADLNFLLVVTHQKLDIRFDRVQCLLPHKAFVIRAAYDAFYPQ
jgi:hypothetical protein